MIVPLYAPGEWFAVVTDGSVAILPPATDLGLVAEVWTSLRDGARLTEQLQMLLRGGIEALPPFALVSVEGGQVHAIVRGQVEVEVESPAGRRTLSAAAVSTWAEETVADASTVTVRTPGLVGSSIESSLPVLAAVVRAAGVRVELRPSSADAAPAGPGVVIAVPFAATAGGTAEAAPEQAAEQAPTPEPEQAPVLTPTPEPEPAPTSEPAPASEPELVLADLGDLDYTLLQPTAAGLAGRNGSGLHALTASAPVGTGVPGPHRAPAPLVEPAVQGDVVHVGAPAEPAPAPSARAQPGAGDLEAVDHDGMTVLSSDVVALRQQLPAWVGDAMPGPLAVPAPRTPAPAKLLLSSGLVVSLNRPVLLGRAPQVSRVSNSAIPRLVTVASPNQDISRTHAEVRMDGEDVLVTDLRSTNGVLLLRQGSGPQRLHPGEPTAVEPGVVVDLGEGVTFTVERGE
ncbi:FHA domain-containing protein [Cellulomonas sp. KRMCY2]|uniref:FHA domain-containing protein n=1 Tax=Cellulomonas sp. KRMCY2 TaxID=1304865 RepID=UPI00045E842F|nr:FHA domain-containing protein [Cellulomonas sp. KRMCY2]